MGGEDMAVEEMSAGDAEMMAEPKRADLNEGMQGAAGDVPVDEPGMAMHEPPMDEPGTVDEEPGPVAEPLVAEPWLAVPPGTTLVPASEGLVDPSTLEAHPLTNSMPLKPEAEYEALRESIRVNGLQQPLTRFEGKILDGRHRLRACTELGGPVAVMDFVGSTDAALVYMLQANQYHHDYGIGQRSTVAALLEPKVAEMVAQGRCEKVRAAWDAKRDGGCREKIPDNLGDAIEEVRARQIAGRMMRVNDRYVGFALRIQREAPELFWKVHAGAITLQAALKELNGEVDDAEQQQIKTARTRLSRVFRDPDRRMPFLERLNALLDEFEQ